VKDTVSIDHVTIGPGYPPYIIAEISANHHGDIQQALKLVELAKKSGANAVKLQTYTPDTMTLDSDKKDFLIQDGPWAGSTLYSLYKQAHTPWQWHEKIFARAGDLGITCFSSPFDETAVDFLETLNVPAYKIASFEMTDIPLVDYIAQKKKPVIVSTGLASVQEIADTVKRIQSIHDQIILMHCVSGYPAPASQYNLRIIPDLRKKMNVLVGLSDHTLGTATAIAGVSVGAVAIEKHFIEDRTHKGPDSAFSVEPDELAQLCRDSKTAWASLGEVSYALKPSEKENLKFRRSIYFVQDMEKGQTIKADHIRRIRPGYGLPPKYFNELIGRRVKTKIEKGTPASFDLLVDG
jgi:pseudaminic acid synthase